MQLGACLAGLAIENSMLGAAHALANPLTATYGIAHGEAIALMLPHVVRHNGQQFESWYGELVECRATRTCFELNRQRLPRRSPASFRISFPIRPVWLVHLNECDVPRDDLPKLAAAATQQWTGKFNPVELSGDDYLKLYEAAF